MSQTGHIHPKDASVKIVCGAGSIALSAHGNSTDITNTADDLEATAYGDTSHTFIDGLTTFTFDFGGWWAGSHATDTGNSTAACLGALVGNSSACVPVFWISPAGSTSGSICYVACVNVQSAPMSFPADGIATMNATFTARAGSLTACANSIW